MVFTYKNDYVMSNLYSKIHRLKAQGWTWEQFHSEIEQLYPAGLEEKTLKAHFKYPHRKASRHVKKTIETLHRKYFPSPFPDDVEALMRVYSNLVTCTKHTSTDQDIADLNLYVTGALQQPQGDNLLRPARQQWLLANIHFDQLPSLRTGSQAKLLAHTQQKAIKHYSTALSLLIEHNDGGNSPSVSEFMLYKLRQNILACHLNILPAEQRFKDESVLKYLKDSDFLPRSKVVMNEEPYQWVVARNGLRFSSITENKTDSLWFFEALVNASQYFQDLKYQPLGYPAIIDSPEFSWSIKNVLTKSF